MYVIFFDSVQNQLNPDQTSILFFLTNKTFDGTVLGLDTSLNLVKLMSSKRNHAKSCFALKEGYVYLLFGTEDFRSNFDSSKST